MIHSSQSNNSFKATKLWNQLTCSFVEGIQLKRKRYRLKTFEDCFSGNSALIFMHNHIQYHPSFGSHVTIKQSKKLLQKFLEKSIFENVTDGDNKQFKSNYLYRFTEETKLQNKYSSHRRNPTQGSLNNLFKSFRRSTKNLNSDHISTPISNNVNCEIRPIRRNTRRRIVSMHIPSNIDLKDASFENQKPILKRSKSVNLKRKNSQRKLDFNKFLMLNSSEFNLENNIEYTSNSSFNKHCSNSNSQDNLVEEIDTIDMTSLYKSQSTWTVNTASTTDDIILSTIKNKSNTANYFKWLVSNVSVEQSSKDILHKTRQSFRRKSCKLFKRNTLRVI